MSNKTKNLVCLDKTHMVICLRKVPRHDNAKVSMRLFQSYRLTIDAV